MRRGLLLQSYGGTDYGPCGISGPLSPPSAIVVWLRVTMRGTMLAPALWASGQR